MAVRPAAATGARRRARLPAAAIRLRAAAIRRRAATAVSRLRRAAAIHRRLFPLIKALFLDGNPAGIKHAMKLAGRDTGELRLPLWEANEATRKAIEEQVRKFL